MKRNYYTLLGLVLLALPLEMNAQTEPKDTTQNRTVIVEQEYIPEITTASKVNVLPKVEEPAVVKEVVQYATTAIPASDIPAGTMQAYTGKEKPAETTPGFVRVGYGSYNNLDLLGNYLFRLTPKDKLNINFKMTGMQGDLDIPNSNEEWDAYYFRTRANLDYIHQFNTLDLNVSGNFGLSNFNYLPGTYGRQKFTSGDFHVGAKSTDETLPLQFQAETNLMMYSRQNNPAFGKLDETLIRTKGNVTGNIDDEQLVGINLAMNNLFYKQNSFTNRTTVDLNPYYELRDDNWHLHAGAHIDLGFGSGKAFRVAPDVTAQFIFSDSYVLYAKATGGRLLNDFRRMEEITPYAEVTRLSDTYEQLNTSIGFKASPVSGVWFNLFGGYQNLKDDAYEYQQRWIWDSSSQAGYDLMLEQMNTSNLYTGAEVSYAYKDLFSVSAEGIYRHWKCKNVTPLWMKPKFHFGFHADVRPVSALLLNLGYEYVHRDNKDISAVNNLNIGASYSLFKGVSIYAQVNNLLNKNFEYYLLYPVQGINFLGGLSFKF